MELSLELSREAFIETELSRIHTKKFSRIPKKKLSK